MADADKRMKKLIAELDATLRELGSFEAYRRVKPQAMPPATEAQIRAYEAHLGHALPPSYRAFLSMHDGYKALAYPGDMLGIADVMPGGAWHERIAKWKKTSLRYGAEEVADAIPIANMGQPNNWVFLSPSRTNKRTKEMRVVEWEPEDSEEYPSVIAFLEECLETARYGIAQAKGLVDEEDE